MAVWTFDDFTQNNERNHWDRFLELKKINPAFKVDLFCIPEGYGGCSDEFVQSLPEWVEVCLHGRQHLGHECENWSKDEMLRLLDDYEKKPRWAHVFKAPRWYVSKGVMQACQERNWILAHIPTWRVPPIPGLRIYDHTKRESEHGHINGCGNGIDQIWDYFKAQVVKYQTFEFISEVVK